MPRTASIGRLSVADLQAEISRRQRTVSKLVKQRNRLVSKLTKLERLISDAGGDVGSRRGGAISGRRRAKNHRRQHTQHAARHGDIKGALQKRAPSSEAGVVVFGGFVHGVCSVKVARRKARHCAERVCWA